MCGVWVDSAAGSLLVW